MITVTKTITYPGQEFVRTDKIEIHDDQARSGVHFLLVYMTPSEILEEAEFMTDYANAKMVES